MTTCFKAKPHILQFYALQMMINKVNSSTDYTNLSAPDYKRAELTCSTIKGLNCTTADSEVEPHMITIKTDYSPLIIGIVNTIDTYLVVQTK